MYIPRIMKAIIWTASPTERRAIPASRKPVIFPIKITLIPLSNKMKIKIDSNNVPNRLSKVRKRELTVDTLLSPAIRLPNYSRGGFEQYSD